MAFWNVPSDIVPKQSHKWVVKFGDKNELTFLAKSVDRPSYTIGSTQAKYLYSHTINFPNRVKWNPINIVLYDAKYSEANNTQTSTEYFFHNFINKMYLNPESASSVLKKYAFKNELTKNLLNDKSLEIWEVYDYNKNENREKITLKNPIISDIKFGTLDYSSDQVLTITLTINYDWAEIFLVQKQ